MHEAEEIVSLPFAEPADSLPYTQELVHTTFLRDPFLYYSLLDV
jgi:hypothetical protein